MLRPPADERDDVERQEGDTTSTGPPWVDLSLLLHPHTLTPPTSLPARPPPTMTACAPPAWPATYPPRSPPRTTPFSQPPPRRRRYVAAPRRPWILGHPDRDISVGLIFALSESCRRGNVSLSVTCTARTSLDRDANVPGDEGEAGSAGTTPCATGPKISRRGGAARIFHRDGSALRDDDASLLACARLQSRPKRPRQQPCCFTLPRCHPPLHRSRRSRDEASAYAIPDKRNLLRPPQHPSSADEGVATRIYRPPSCLPALPTLHVPLPHPHSPCIQPPPH
ncbi:hypothetical protein C8J57DRAFT_1532996 [Mycena rebaudengoi]|nr:hypothetical protein C8J57DRAFT_1532996 [Mycena rebaudengoi]